MDKIAFNKIDIQDFTVILVLGIALIMSICFGMKELSMSIASGLLGYIGGTATSAKKESQTQTPAKTEPTAPTTGTKSTYSGSGSGQCMFTTIEKTTTTVPENTEKKV